MTSPNKRTKPISIHMIPPSGGQTIAAANTPQTLFPNHDRSYLIVCNNSSSVMMLTTDDSTPSATNGIPINPGGAYEPSVPPKNSIRIWCATAGAQFYAVVGN